MYFKIAVMNMFKDLKEEINKPTNEIYENTYNGTKGGGTGGEGQRTGLGSRHESRNRTTKENPN